MKADIIHIAGFDTYNTHDSGNYIVFNNLRPLGLNQVMILGLQKTKNENDLIYMPKNKIVDSIEECKILVLHDELLDPKQIEEIHKKTNCKIVMISQTHYHITGGCSYPVLADKLVVNQCERFKDSCGSCPDKKSNIAQDETYVSMSAKKKHLMNLPITVVVGSSHSKMLTQQSPLYKQVELIPLPNDIFFCDFDKKLLRQKNNLNPDLKYVFWGTTQPQTQRKGKAFFDAALDCVWEKLDEKERSKIVVVYAGPQKLSFGNKSKFQSIHLGYIPTRRLMSAAYRLSDISVCTTLSDAGPMMITESCMNETPVIAFDQSIAIDLIENDKTGYLIENFDVEDMAKKTIDLLYHTNLEGISKAARAKALQFHDKDVVLAKWKLLFETLAGN